MKITVLHGADALEPPVDPVIEQVVEALIAGGHEASTIVVDTRIEPVVHALNDQQPELVFNLTESFRTISSLDSNLAALLNLLGLRYTGSSPAGLMLAGDKSLSKKVLSFHRIPTPDFATLYRGALDHVGELRFPVIVKPPQEDASIGINEGSVVYDLPSLLRRIDELHETFKSPVLVEEFIPGREFYVGVLGNAHAEALPVIELQFKDSSTNPDRVAGFALKWDASRERETASAFPGDLPEDLILRDAAQCHRHVPGAAPARLRAHRSAPQQQRRNLRHRSQPQLLPGAKQRVCPSRRTGRLCLRCAHPAHCRAGRGALRALKSRANGRTGRRADGQTGKRTRRANGGRSRLPDCPSARLPVMYSTAYHFQQNTP